MNTKLHSLAALAVASVLLVAACGGSSSPPKSPPAKQKTSKAPTKKTTPPASTTPTGSTGSTSSFAGVSASALKAEGQACQTTYASLGAVIGGSAAADFEGICKGFATGNVATAKAAVAKFCTNDIGSLPAAVQAAVSRGCASFRKAYGG